MNHLTLNGTAECSMRFIEFLFKLKLTTPESVDAMTRIYYGLLEKETEELEYLGIL